MTKRRAARKPPSADAGEADVPAGLRPGTVAPCASPWPMPTAPPAAAETRQHGNIVFAPPAGWALGAVQDGGTQMLSDRPNDECKD
ncbi:hypothetical protein LHP98_08830 [Rhodobacter sp. Har01]|uniref:hypothetical protein n=1 Tax=Rhodobacter sp. Har01 TaxID=2883999 RepID=UPI001D07E721|nr:hypothetical protein [Rhodobacter sp. Har01]MCB6178232.1 hypothetical protein [Rhodobacter sp. Har01]